MSKYILSLLSCALFLTPAGAQMVPIAPLKDAALYESLGTQKSNGAGAFLFAGTTKTGAIRRALLAFDVSAHIPAGALITSVELTLHMDRTIAAAHPLALQPVLAPWSEGLADAAGAEGDGSLAAQDDVTWAHRSFADTSWNTPGGDFNPAASATQAVDGNGFYTWGSTPALVADVQAWLDEPKANFGWILIGNENQAPTAKRFASRQHPVPDQRPVLTVSYTTVQDNQPPVLAPAGPFTTIEGNALAISLSATDPDGDPLTLTGDLPPGATLADGTITWEPAQAGQYLVFLTATDDRGGTTSGQLRIRVLLPGDFNQDDVVDNADFALFLKSFGDLNDTFDLDLNGRVGLGDFLLFVDHFGRAVTP
ncbi:MAG: DNRLRE domain-containing protein [Candidatus Latescibacteria bacterium]|nr:DNRLRE domain-containing protein [Candidatus Latescibacterota bacterium]